MKKFLYFFTLILILSGCSSKELDITNIEKKNGIVYEKGNEKPFSGTITKYMDDTLLLEIGVKKGKYHGEFNLYNKEGELLLRKTFESGELIKEEKFANDIEIFKNRINSFLDSLKL